MLRRRVEPEALDGLAADDPVAEHSRRDLRRVHRCMGTRSLLVREMRRLPAPATGSMRILELGAGDGSLLLGVARDLAPSWPPVDLTLLDRIAVVDARTVARYGRCGWTVTSSAEDALDWARAATGSRGSPDAARRWDLVVANLFLHHFDGPELALLLAAVAASSDGLMACEPRRGWRALAGSHLVGAIGANAVTRGDAVLSVRAGFRERELTALWPAPRSRWRLREHAVGAFSHFFGATRVEANA
jgi:hypothetical protein